MSGKVYPRGELPQTPFERWTHCPGCGTPIEHEEGKGLRHFWHEPECWYAEELSKFVKDPEIKIKALTTRVEAAEQYVSRVRELESAVKQAYSALALGQTRMAREILRQVL